MDVGCIDCLNLVVVQTLPNEWFMNIKYGFDGWIE